MHHKQEKHLLRLKGIAPHLFMGNQLAKKGFINNKPEEEYLGFELKSTNPITLEGCEHTAVNLRTKGNQSYRPYFITLKELFKN